MKKFNVVISGCFTASGLKRHGRDEVKKYLTDAGHNVQSSICKSTNYLIIGTADVPGRGVGPSKMKLAKEFDIPVVTLSEFKQIAA